jgi:hypothetical protein
VKIKNLTLIILPTLIFWGSNDPVAGQVNIEKLRRTGEEQGFSTDLGLVFSARSGNVDITQLGLDVQTDYVRKRSTSLVVFRGLYGWKDGDPFSNEGLIHMRHVYRRQEWFHAEAFAQTDYDKSRLLDFRAVVGGGGRFNIFQTETIELSWGTAYMLEHEVYDLPTRSLHSPDATAHRWSNYVSFKMLFSKRAGATWITYLQPRFDAFEDLRMLGEGGLESTLTDLLSLTLTLRLRYDSAPPDGIQKYDTFVAAGLELGI